MAGVFGLPPPGGQPERISPGPGRTYLVLGGVAVVWVGGGLARAGLRHLVTRRCRPRTNGVAERFHETMGRERGYGVL
jgi:hypothetical protein